MQPGGDVHSVAEDIAVPLHDIARMDADAHMNLFSRVFLSVVGTELRQDLLGTLHGIYYRWEIHQEGIAHNLDDGAVVFTHRLVDGAIMHFEQPQHAGFITAHLAAKADDVGEHNCG